MNATRARGRRFTLAGLAKLPLIGAKRRLADEYDAAQRGEVSSHGGDRKINVPDGNVENIGITRKEMHGARLIRDAEMYAQG